MGCGRLFLEVILIFVLYVYYSIRYIENLWKGKDIKYIHPNSRFLFENVSFLRTKSEPELSVDLYQQFPDEKCFVFYQLLQPILLIKDPELIKEITVTHVNNFIDRRPFVACLWNRDAFGSRYLRGRNQRRKLNQLLTVNNVELMHDLIKSCAKIFVSFFDLQDEELFNIEATETISRYVNDVIASTSFGLQCNSLEEPNNEFYQMGQKAINYSEAEYFKTLLFRQNPIIGELLELQPIPRSVLMYFNKSINSAILQRLQQKIARPDMIHLFLEAQKEDYNEITIDDYLSQVFAFFLGGFHSVTTFLSFAFYELAIHRDIQNRLRGEIKRNFKTLSFVTLQEMKYLDMVISEVLRKWPVASFTERQATKSFTINNETPFLVKKDIVCSIPIFAIQNDPKYFPDPEMFDPERFSNEEKHLIKPNTYMPFGSGPNACLGQHFALLEAKLLLCYVLEKFSIVPIPRTPMPVVFDKMTTNLTPKGGMWLGLKKLI